MKSNIISESESQVRSTPLRSSTRLLDNFAKYAVLQKLDKITKGTIQIIDNNQIHEFGNTDKCNLKAVITVRSSSFYSSVTFAGSVGAGESYFLGDWDCDNLTNLVQLLLINRHVIDDMDSGLSKITAPLNQVFHWLNRNSRSGSKRNISAHYDIGNDLFSLMLDKSMMYSSAIFTGKECSLEQASFNKLDTICKKLDLTPDDHLLEIGTGWGGMAIHAAKYYGCKVTTTTISQQQYDFARERILEESLEDQITLLLQDYRDLDGSYDKLVSIEMIEAVGLNNLNTYFKKCSSLLNENGLMCIQAITMADQRYKQARKEVDFIQKYIFPGGSLPSITAMSESITSSTDMRIINLQDIGMHYAKTLRHWRERFFHNESRIRSLGYSDTFIRLWEFYLCYCEGGFLERSISTVHLVMAKNKYRQKL